MSIGRLWMQAFSGIKICGFPLMQISCACASVCWKAVSSSACCHERGVHDAIWMCACGLLSAHIRLCVCSTFWESVCAMVAGEMICALHNGPTCCVLQRWQRRWFVLYDDGEFTYSVDEHVSVKQSSACGRGAQTKRRPEQTLRLAFVLFVIRKW